VSSRVAESELDGATTNADGTSLNNLSSYRIYLATRTRPVPAPRSSSVESPTRHRRVDRACRVADRATAGPIFARVTAVDTPGTKARARARPAEPRSPTQREPSTTMELRQRRNRESGWIRPYTVLTSTTSLMGTASVGGPTASWPAARFASRRSQPGRDGPVRPTTTDTLPASELHRGRRYGLARPYRDSEPVSRP